jgi:hypothetical protein
VRKFRKKHRNVKTKKARRERSLKFGDSQVNLKDRNRSLKLGGTEHISVGSLGSIHQAMGILSNPLIALFSVFGTIKHVNRKDLYQGNKEPSKFPQM